MDEGRTRTFRYVLHEKVAAYEAAGWISHDSLVGTTHGIYSTLMEFPTQKDQESNGHG